MSKYIDRVLAEVKEKNANEPEFLQTVEEVLESLAPIVDAHPEYEKVALLERMVEPERTIEFRVPWVDDNGQTHVNRGYRVQFNGAIGPYKGGAKGGSDFDPNGKSDAEVMRFCQSFMNELYRHIGPDIDIPAGDLGVGAREIGYMYGQYRKLRGAFENGVITGKGMSFGGSLIRPEATGFGAVYYVEAVMKHENDTIEGKTVAVSGFGNVAWGIVTKLAELGAKAVTLSGPDGYIYDPEGITTKEKIDYMLEMRASGRNRVQDYADKFGVEFFPGQKPFGQKVDIVMPAAMQNDVRMGEAEQIVANGTKYYIEVANMPTTNDALKYLMSQPNMVVAPSKAVNAGGVLVSGLEMSQNSMRYAWTAEEVDEKLHRIMTGIHDTSAATAEKYGLGYNLVAGANLAGFQKVADAMMAQGIAW